MALKGDGRLSSHWSTARYAQTTPTGNEAPKDHPLLDLRRIVVESREIVESLGFRIRVAVRIRVLRDIVRKG